MLPMLGSHLPVSVPQVTLYSVCGTLLQEGRSFRRPRHRKTPPGSRLGGVFYCSLSAVAPPHRYLILGRQTRPTQQNLCLFCCVHYAQCTTLPWGCQAGAMNVDTVVAGQVNTKLDTLHVNRSSIRSFILLILFSRYFLLAWKYCLKFRALQESFPLPSFSGHL